MANRSNWFDNKSRATKTYGMWTGSTTPTAAEVRNAFIVFNTGESVAGIVLPVLTSGADIGAECCLCNDTGGTSSAQTMTVTGVSSGVGFGRHGSSSDVVTVTEGEMLICRWGGLAWYATSAASPQ